MAEELAGDVALQAAFDLAGALALRDSPLDVFDGLGVLAHADHHDGVQGAVELAVTETAQPVTSHGSRRCFDGRDAGELREHCFGANSARMGPRDDESPRDDWADADFVEQDRRDPSNEHVDLGLELGCFVFAGERSSCCRASGRDGGELGGVLA